MIEDKDAATFLSSAIHLLLFEPAASVSSCDVIEKNPAGETPGMH
jgi:hypothetical protein